MIYVPRFEPDGKIYWSVERPKPTDVSHLQGAMFLDRPDLWTGPPRRRRNGTKPLANQPGLKFKEGESNAPR